MIRPKLAGSGSISARCGFLAESLARTPARLARRGQPSCWCLHGEPVALAGRLARPRRPAAVVPWKPEVEAGRRSARPQKWPPPCRPRWPEVLAGWDQLLVPPITLQQKARRPAVAIPYRVYGPYWRRWRQQLEERPAATHPHPVRPSGLQDLDAAASRRWRRAARRSRPRRLRILAQRWGSLRRRRNLRLPAW